MLYSQRPESEFEQQCRELLEAINGFVITIGNAIGLDKLINWFNR